MSHWKLISAGVLAALTSLVERGKVSREGCKVRDATFYPLASHLLRKLRLSDLNLAEEQHGAVGTTRKDC